MKDMIVSAIVATDLNNAIGKDNQLPWNIPADLKFFKKITMGHPVIMGRKTYESMNRLLPGRKNIIITRSAEYHIDGAEIFNSIEAAIAACRNNEDKLQKIFVIGGAEIFKQSFHLLDEMYRTLVQSTFDADTFIPEVAKQGFVKTWEECHDADENNSYSYCFQKWEKLKTNSFYMPTF